MMKNYGRTALLVLTLITSLVFTNLVAHAQDGGITPNYKDADIRQVIEAVAAVTGKNIIVDPRVKAQVTLLSTDPMSPDAFYATFLSILDVYGFTAIETNNIVKILPNANSRQAAPYGVRAAGDEMVTRVVEVKNVGAAQLVPSLRPLLPQHAHLAALTQSNMLVISDTAANVSRIMRIIDRIDRAGDDEIEVVSLINASATDIVRVVNALNGGTRPDNAPANSTNLVADERTNSVLISGEKTARLKIRTLIAHLDTPLEDGGNTQVRYLHYANAEELATKLQNSAQQSQPAAGSAGAGGLANGAVNIWADVPSNALVITAPPKTMRSLMGIIDKIDIRRAQVLVEALIVEVNADRAAELGVTWAVDGSSGTNPISATRFSTAGTNVTSIAAASSGTADPASLAAALGEGVTIGVGRLSDSGTSFAAILSALEGDSSTNVISTPTLVTMDNEQAKIEIGQEVPFITGQFTGAGSTSGSVNPFQTVNREKVGTLLEITPQINEGNSILLKIRQEISSISATVSGAADIVTNERLIETSVIVEDGGILVLGGLIDDKLTETDQRVPILGRLPLIGNLFRSRTTSKQKTNLMVFIRPKILRDGTETINQTNSKYNYMRNLQLGDTTGPGLMRDAEIPVLPPFEDIVDDEQTRKPPQNIMQDQAQSE